MVVDMASVKGARRTVKEDGSLAGARDVGTAWVSLLGEAWVGEVPVGQATTEGIVQGCRKE